MAVLMDCFWGVWVECLDEAEGTFGGVFPSERRALHLLPFSECEAKYVPLDKLLT